MIIWAFLHDIVLSTASTAVPGTVDSHACTSSERSRMQSYLIEQSVANPLDSYLAVHNAIKCSQLNPSQSPAQIRTATKFLRLLELITYNS